MESSVQYRRLNELRKELIHLVCKPPRVRRVQRKSMVALLTHHRLRIGVSIRADEAAIPHETGVELLQLHLVDCARASCCSQGVPCHSHKQGDSLR